MLSKKIQVARSVVVASLVLFLAGPAFANSSAPPVAALESTATMPAPRSPTATRVSPAAETAVEAQQYASREAAARSLETFRGGDGGVYIGSGALVAALLIVLIIVLI